MRFLWTKVPEPGGPRLGVCACINVYVHHVLWHKTASKPGARFERDTGLDRQHQTTVAENAARLPLTWS